MADFVKGYFNKGYFIKGYEKCPIRSRNTQKVLLFENFNFKYDILRIIKLKLKLKQKFELC
jgi:hypothetical protein